MFAYLEPTADTNLYIVHERLPLVKWLWVIEVR